MIDDKDGSIKLLGKSLKASIHQNEIKTSKIQKLQQKIQDFKRKISKNQGVKERATKATRLLKAKESKAKQMGKHIAYLEE